MPENQVLRQRARPDSVRHPLVGTGSREWLVGSAVPTPCGTVRSRHTLASYVARIRQPLILFAFLKRSVDSVRPCPLDSIRQLVQTDRQFVRVASPTRTSEFVNLSFVRVDSSTRNSFQRIRQMPFGRVDWLVAQSFCNGHRCPIQPFFRDFRFITDTGVH